MNLPLCLEVVIEMWGFPVKDAAVTAFFNELKPLLEAPTKLEDVDASLAGYAGLFIPGGHGAMVNLPDSVALGKLLHTRGTSWLAFLTKRTKPRQKLVTFLVPCPG